MKPIEGNSRALHCVTTNFHDQFEKELSKRAHDLLALQKAFLKYHFDPVPLLILMQYQLKDCRDVDVHLGYIR